jgi:hypothetical protein
MRLLRLIVEVSRLFATVTILELQCAYEKGTRHTVYKDRWATIDIAQKELFNSSESRFDIVSWGGIGAETESLECVKRGLLTDLRLLTAGWVPYNEDREPRERTRKGWFEQGLEKLLKPHICRRLFTEYEQSAAHVDLSDETRWRAAEILANHQGVPRHRYKAALRYMKLRAKRRAEDRLP